MLSNRLQVLESLRTATFPADRAELVRVAEREGADEEVRRALAEIDDRTYGSAREVAEQFPAELPPSAAGSGPRGFSAAGDDLGEHPSVLNPPDSPR